MTFSHFVKQKMQTAAFLPPSLSLALAEGLAVSALVLGGIGLMGAHQDPVQGAVVLAVAVICAGLDGAFDALVCMAVHKSSSLVFGYRQSMPPKRPSMLEMVSCVDFIWNL